MGTPAQLVIGEIYTSREILDIMKTNDDLVLCNNVYILADTDRERFKVKECMRTYVHSCFGKQYYLLPNTKQNVYVVEKVES
ncbi:hypothetical protein DCMF_02995 [Candidatus Formimonas warabiya]|uniref:Uncharacterized protein n=1 Tax=Formimonas warabiya TaxID=1761012 RepID=A0A3G1KN64_FORW1|nr:hypothetical protein DCMF_02995 [Candidatus Formimonas warabiya]